MVYKLSDTTKHWYCNVNVQSKGNFLHWLTNSSDFVHNKFMISYLKISVTQCNMCTIYFKWGIIKICAQIDDYYFLSAQNFIHIAKCHYKSNVLSCHSICIQYMYTYNDCTIYCTMLTEKFSFLLFSRHIFFFFSFPYNIFDKFLCNCVRITVGCEPFNLM